jgi:hypothetical protein
MLRRRSTDETTHDELLIVGIESSTDIAAHGKNTCLIQVMRWSPLKDSNIQAEPNDLHDRQGAVVARSAWYRRAPYVASAALGAAAGATAALRSCLRSLLLTLRKTALVLSDFPLTGVIVNHAGPLS